MTLKKRNGVWQIDLTVPGMPRYRESTHTRDETIARVKHADAERMLALGHDVVHGRKVQRTLAEAFDRANREHWRGHKSIDSVRAHQAIILRALPGTTALAHVAGKLDELLKALHVGREDATVNRILQTLRTTLNLCVEWDWLAKAPKLPRYKEPAGRIRVYTSEEMATIYEFFEPSRPDMGKLVRLLLATGLRLGEALDRPNLDVGNRSLTVWDTKTATQRVPGRTVPLSSETEDLALWWKAGVSELRTKDQVEWSWRVMRGACFPTDRTVIIHALRHTCCTRLIQGRMPIAKVMLWMGHRDIHTTLRYTHLTAADLTEGVALVTPEVS